MEEFQFSLLRKGVLKDIMSSSGIKIIEFSKYKHHIERLENVSPAQPSKSPKLFESKDSG